VKALDLAEMTDDELRQRLNERMEALWSYQIQKTTGAVENIHAARNTRKDIARIKTIIRQRELAAQGGTALKARKKAKAKQ
jgi:large subunit ribosomal protein L29